MSQPRLSALVVARNEERQLADCLAALAFADELVVVLDRSTDGSRAIALARGAKLVEGAWDIEGDRRNTGIAVCAGDWILEVDADERVTPALAAEIREAIGATAKGCFLIPFDNYVGDRLIRHGWGGAWGVQATTRLFAKGGKVWGRQRIHPSVALKGERGTLKSPMIHYVDRDISDMLRRLDRYSAARAQDLRDSGDIGSFAGNLRRLFTRFFKCYIGRQGYREGYHGFLIALFAGLYPLLSHLRARLEKE